MTKKIRLTSYVLYLAALCLFAFIIIGCASPQKKVKQRYFFPFPPEAPRLEWLATYSSQDDFPKTMMQRFMESLIGGGPKKSFVRPWGIVSDGEGRVFVADTNGAMVVVYDLKKYTIEAVGEGSLEKPLGVALDKDGNLYISDERKRSTIFVYDKDLKPLRVIEYPEFTRPAGIAVNDRLGRLYVADSRKSNIVVFDLATGKPISVIGKRGVRSGEFNFPVAIAIDSKDNLIVSDSMNARVQILDKDGNFIRRFGERGVTPGFFQLIKGVAVDKNDNIYVVDGSGDNFSVFDKEGNYLLTVGETFSTKGTKKAGVGGLFIPTGIFIDKNGALYLVDSMNRRFHVYQVVDEEWLKKNPVEK